LEKGSSSAYRSFSSFPPKGKNSSSLYTGTSPPLSLFLATAFLWRSQKLFLSPHIVNFPTPASIFFLSFFAPLRRQTRYIGMSSPLSPFFSSADVRICVLPPVLSLLFNNTPLFFFPSQISSFFCMSDWSKSFCTPPLKGEVLPFSSRNAFSPSSPSPAPRAFFLLFPFFFSGLREKEIPFFSRG